MQSKSGQLVALLGSSLTRPRRASATPFPQLDATVLGMRLRYISVGPTETETGPPLLLIHGLSSRIEEYDALVPHLARSRRVLVVDLPGSGYSDKPTGHYTLVAAEDALLGFLDVLGVSSVDVGGASLGGNLSLRLAARAPDRVRRVVAWAPAGAWRPRRWLRTLARVPFARLLFWPLIKYVSQKWYRPGWAGRDRALADAFVYYREVHGPSFARMYVELAAEQLSDSLFHLAARIAHPTLLAVGEHDHALGMNAGVRALARLLPKATLHIFPGGHSLATEEPQRLALQADAFLTAGLGA